MTSPAQRVGTAPRVGAGQRVGIVGGGPAGLAAAEVLAGAGVAVTVFDHRRSPGNKFLLAGRGGLNITHSEPLEQLLDRYGPDRAFVEPAVRSFAPTELQAWLDGLGEPAFVGSSGRVFPASMRATPLLRAWLGRLQELGVQVQTSQRWIGFGNADAGAGVDGEAGQQLLDVREPGATPRVEQAHAWLFALGGGSWPRVGSDGAWLEPFTQAGIATVPIQASNCGVAVAWTPVLRDRFAGEPIKNVAVSAGGSKARGDVVVTESGLEGGPIYAQSRALRSQLREGDSAELLIDLHPDLPHESLRERLERRGSGATATSWLRGAGLSPVKIALLREATANQLPSAPHEMATLVKGCPIAVTGMASVDRAISTSGGIAKHAVDESFMLRAKPGTFVAGEMIDWDAPTGGYLLQASMSTGVAAAHGMLTWLYSQR